MSGLLLVYLLAAVGMVGALWAPRIGLFVYVGFAVLRPHYLWGWAGSMAGLSQAVGIAMLVGWVFAGLGAWRFERARSIVIALLAFTVWSALSAVQAENTATAWAALLELAKIVLPFLVGVTVLQSVQDIRRLLWIIVLAQAYISFEMNRSYLNGFNQAWVEGYGGMDNNCLGLSLVTTLGASTALVMSSSKWTERALGSVASVVILHTILLTFSRGALLGLLVSGATAFIMMPKRPRYLVAGVVVILLAIRLTGPELAARYQSTFAEADERDGSATSRLELWRDCLTVIASQPFFGVGPHNWPLIAEKYGWPPGKEAHSVWVQTGAEVGIPGVFALLAFYFLAMWKLWAVVRRRKGGRLTPRQAIAFGLSLGFAGYVSSAQFVSLTGLELPFYLVMIAVVLLRQPEDVTAVPALAHGFVVPQTRIAALPLSNGRASSRPASHRI